MRARRAKACFAAAAGAALALAPRASLACSVCMSGRDDETQAAFLATTGFLTVLPLVMVGGLVWWLRRRARALDAAEAEAEGAASGQALSRTSSSR